MGRRLGWVIVVVACCVLAASSAGAAKRRPLQHVTIFGDSVAAVLNWDPTARHVLARSDRLTLELSPCGRLTQPGCISPPPPSVLSEVRALGRRIGPNVVILIGYNDNPHVYAAGIDEVLKAMRKRGVKHVLWLTLRAVYQQYRLVNEVIHGASVHFPTLMTLVDWNNYSAGHTSWFSSDGIHMTSEGGVQFAIFVHSALKQLGLTGPLPAATG